MALNKYMHPRNIYKVPPDFSILCKIYPEFANIAKNELSGKVSINFKDPFSLRILTKCLLHHDFNLTVEIPEDRLVPTLPLRLNYILWIEDLMIATGKRNNIKGLDIGTGVCAIYPLLAVAQNKWNMVGTESDETNFELAQKNVVRNNLQHLITISKNRTDTLVEYLLTEKSDLIFDFCMCNPPFYSTIEELCESRSAARPEPKNCFTGSFQELITEGGELKFIRKLIAESKVFKDKISIFTTMVGHKCNLKLLLQDLRTDNITHTHTEFCQGRTTRWGLAWTFKSHNLQKLVPPRDKIRKKNTPLSCVLPGLPGVPHNLENAFHKIKFILNDLNIKNTTVSKRMHKIEISILAVENTWSNQRRKRRLMKRIKELDHKKAKTCEDKEELPPDSEVINVEEKVADKDVTLIEVNTASCLKKESIAKQSPCNSMNLCIKSKNNTIAKHNNEENESSIMSGEEAVLKLENHAIQLHKNERRTSSCETRCSTTLCNGNIEVKASSSHDSNMTNSGICVTALNNNNLAEKSSFHNTTMVDLDLQSMYDDTLPVVQGIAKLISANGVITLELEFLIGSGGKESIHQILQYIKNNWK